MAKTKQVKEAGSIHRGLSLLLLLEKWFDFLHSQTTLLSNSSQRASSISLSLTPLSRELYMYPFLIHRNILHFIGMVIPTTPAAA